MCQYDKCHQSMQAEIQAAMTCYNQKKFFQIPIFQMILY